MLWASSPLWVGRRWWLAVVGSELALNGAQPGGRQRGRARQGLVARRAERMAGNFQLPAKASVGGVMACEGCGGAVERGVGLGEGGRVVQRARVGQGQAAQPCSLRSGCWVEPNELQEALVWLAMASKDWGRWRIGRQDPTWARARVWWASHGNGALAGRRRWKGDGKGGEAGGVAVVSRRSKWWCVVLTVRACMCPGQHTESVSSVLDAEVVAGVCQTSWRA
ncbi:hypothetical protein BDV93DRAFT_510875 [Ceratobasidium sp. AG-I]|nr:hypothetical protein BDV93DRAFT_510875 [Ceratobasidium sp. AG-I]